jgi:DNA replication protein DnaC
MNLLAERLHLPDLPAELPALADQAASASWSYAEFAERLLTRSAEAADRRAEATLVRLAGLPFRKSLAEFEFAFQPSLSEKQLRELAGCAFLERHENVLLLGPPGTGKTHPGRRPGPGSLRPPPSGALHNGGTDDRLACRGA